MVAVEAAVHLEAIHPARMAQMETVVMVAVETVETVETVVMVETVAQVVAPLETITATVITATDQIVAKVDGSLMLLIGGRTTSPGGKAV